MTSLIEMMRRQFPTDADAAARLCLSRQAYSQAIKRGRFSNETALRCADLLNIDRAAALLANCPAAEYLPAPVSNPTPDAPPEFHISTVDTTNYAFMQDGKKGADCADNAVMLHKITSPEQEEATDLIRWVYAVAGLRADSPRFNQYVSRWVVPQKIAQAKANGTFEERIRNCPPIDPSWIRLVPEAMKAYQEFVSSYPSTGPTKTKPASSPEKQTPRNNARRVA